MQDSSLTLRTLGASGPAIEAGDAITAPTFWDSGPPPGLDATPEPDQTAGPRARLGRGSGQAVLALGGAGPGIVPRRGLRRASVPPSTHLEDFLAGRDPRERYVLGAVTWQAQDLVASVLVAPTSPDASEPEPRPRPGFVIRARGVLEASLEVGELAPRELDCLTARLDDPLLGVLDPPACLILKEPLADPHRFFVDFTFLLANELDAREHPADYLCAALDADFWRQRVAQPGELLRGPASLVAAAGRLVGAQGASCEVRLGRRPTRSPREPAVVLRLGPSWVVCRSVEVMATPPVAARVD